MDTDRNSLELGGVLAMLRRRAAVVVLCTALTATAAFAVCSRQAKQYTATASLVFNNNQQAEQVAGLQAVALGNQQAQQDTNLKLVKLGDMAEKTARQAGHGLTEKRVREDIAVEAQGESDIVDVSATERSPALAAAVANAYANQFVAEQQGSNHAYYASALALVNRQLAMMSPKQRLSPAGLALQGRAQSLGVLAELKNGNVQVAQRAALPTGPSSPKTTRNTALGGLLGLLLGLGLAFLLERLDRRVRETKDLERIYGLPLLGAVPESKALSRADVASQGVLLPAAEAEAFHLIRAHLRYFNVDRQLRTIMVVSSAPGEGKTTVARHLAAVAATVGSRVLLIELDLRRPTLARRLGVPPGPGLCDVLIGAASLQEATRSIDVGSSGGQAGVPRSLEVLVSGSVLPPNPTELIESRAMEGLLARVKSIYDLVVIDTPPLTAVSDAFPLLGHADGIVVVGRLGYARRDLAERLQETLRGAHAPLLGVVANGVKSGALGSYGYSYEAHSPEAELAVVASTNGAASERSEPILKG
jgi:polysaccharide biosynthesis transport protein